MYCKVATGMITLMTIVVEHAIGVTFAFTSTKGNKLQWALAQILALRG